MQRLGIKYARLFSSSGDRPDRISGDFVRTQDVEQISREMTELRRRIQELQALCDLHGDTPERTLEWEMRFRSLAQSPLYGIVSLDPLLHVSFWNQGAERIFGYPEHEILGRHVSLLIPDLSELVSRIHDDKLIPPGEVLTIGRPFECRGVGKNREPFPLELCLSSWKGRTGVSYSAIIHDITYRKKALETLQFRTEEARRRTQDLETLIQTVAHDLKSPVVTVKGLASRLIRKSRNTESDPEIDQILRQIEASTQSMETFLRDLLDGLSAPHTKLAWAPVNLSATIEGIIRQHKEELEESGIAVMTCLEDDLPHVLGDQQRIARVLDNLVANAIRHMGEVADPLLKIDCRTTTGFVMVSVSDNGLGIPPELHSRIFDRFFRSPTRAPGRGGSGLGLFIAKKFVESHQGRIWVESQTGTGTTFHFTLPKFIPGGSTDYEI